MTEERWLQGANPLSLLTFIQNPGNRRKLRLLACAWVRADESLLGNGRLRDAIEEIERSADSLAGVAETASTLEVIREAAQAPALWRRHWALTALASLGRVREEAWELFGLHQCQEHWGELCRLLRELFGNPFRSTLILSSWLTWNDGTVGKLARVLDAERRFDELGVLADALEDAGCDDAEILSHLRGPGPHVRGCWALDLILGKS
jgi:hypothetical protein